MQIQNMITRECGRKKKMNEKERERDGRRKTEIPLLRKR